jgi:hypothetical protein
MLFIAREKKRSLAPEFASLRILGVPEAAALKKDAHVNVSDRGADPLSLLICRKLYHSPLSRDFKEVAKSEWQ